MSLVASCHRSILAILVLAPAAGAAPLSLAGFTFADGEVAFADDAWLVSGSGVRFGNCMTGTAVSSLAEALSGSDLEECVNVVGGGNGVVEVLFADNSILNGPGTDLVIFELSGPQSPGTPDPRERFELSVFDGSLFSSFTAFDPIATGFGIPGFPESTLAVFAIQVDLSAFGIAPGARVGRVQLHLFDNGLGSKGADIVALGALSSGAPVPEPSSGLLCLFGLLWLAARRPTRRCS